MEFVDPEYVVRNIVTVSKGVVKPTKFGMCYAMALRAALDVVNNFKPGTVGDYDSVESWNIPEGSGLSWFFKYIETHDINRYVMMKAAELNDATDYCLMWAVQCGHVKNPTKKLQT